MPLTEQIRPFAEDVVQIARSERRPALFLWYRFCAKDKIKLNQYFNSMKLLNYLFTLVVLLGLLFVSCSRDELDDVVNSDSQSEFTDTYRHQSNETNGTGTENDPGEESETNFGIDPDDDEDDEDKGGDDEYRLNDDNKGNGQSSEAYETLIPCRQKE